MHPGLSGCDGNQCPAGTERADGLNGLDFKVVSNYADDFFKRYVEADKFIVALPRGNGKYSAMLERVRVKLIDYRRAGPYFIASTVAAENLCMDLSEYFGKEVIFEMLAQVKYVFKFKEE